MSGKHRRGAPAPAKYGHWPMFHLDLEDITRSYAKLIKNIKKEIKRRNEADIQKGPKLERMPSDVKGKLYTPLCGYFLVQLHYKEKVVTLLFRWSDLYFLAFNARDEEPFGTMAFVSRHIWFHCEDFNISDVSDLPPTTQVWYDARKLRGIKELPFSSNYNKMGGFKIFMGRKVFISTFDTFDNAGDLMLTAAGMAKLRSGPFAVPVIGISEALRWALFLGWMQSILSLDVPVMVPARYSCEFRKWSKKCRRFIAGKTVRGRDLNAVLGIILRSEVEEVTLTWGGNASTSKSKLIERALLKSKNNKHSRKTSTSGSSSAESSDQSSSGTESPSSRGSPDEGMHQSGNRNVHGQPVDNNVDMNLSLEKTNTVSAVASRSSHKVSGEDASLACPIAKAEKGAAAADNWVVFDNENEDKQAAAERAAYSAYKGAKKKEGVISSVLMDIKPRDEKTDMNKLEESVRSIQMESLIWGASTVVPVGYGIKKLQIMLTFMDDVVSVETLIDEVLCQAPINNYVQSCDVVAFNKI